MSEKRTCPRCGKENDADATNCVRCGIVMDEVEGVFQKEPEAPEFFCFRHPKVATNLRCGRCERPICTRCAVMGPNGVRCPECAKQNIAVRPGAVVHEVKRSAMSLFRWGPWGIWIMILIVGMLFSMFRSCGSRRPPPPEEDAYYREEQP